MAHTLIAPTHSERRAAKRLAYAAARQARAARPGARGWRRACGGHVPWVEAPPEYRGTTVQVCGLWPFSAGSGTPTDGVPLGKHQLTGATVCGDPIMWFLSRRILNPSAFVLGRPGLGKSTLVRRIVNVSAGFGIIPLILSDLKPDYPDLGGPWAAKSSRSAANAGTSTPWTRDHWPPNCTGCRQRPAAGWRPSRWGGR